MIAIEWLFKDGFWTVTADIDTEKEDDVVFYDPSYCPVPAAKGRGVSRYRNHAISFALEDLADNLRKATKGAI